METKQHIIHGDSKNILGKMENNSVDLLITSPPYFNARDYSTWENLESYLADMRTIFRESYRVLKDNRFAIVNISDVLGRTNQSPASRKRISLAAHFILMLQELGFTYMEDFIWDKGEVHSKRHFAGRPFPFQKYPINSYEHILVFAKKPADGGNFASCPKCGNTHLYKKGWQNGYRVFECRNHVRKFAFSRKSRLQVRYEKAENQISPELLKFWHKDVAKFHPTTANRKAKNGLVGHTAPFPEKIPEFAMTFYSGVGDLVLDPFVGSGTSGVVAKKLSRNFVGIELHAEYVKLARARIARTEVENGK